MKIILVLAACCFVVNGRTHENGKNNRDLIPKALPSIQWQDMQFSEQMLMQPENQWLPHGINGKIEQLQIVLEILMENLEAFKEEDNDEGQKGGLHAAIDNLNDEILNLNETLIDATRSQVLLQNPLWRISNKLERIHGSEFSSPFWKALFANGGMFDGTTEENEITEIEYTNPSPGERLSQMAEAVKEITSLARIITNEGKVTKDLADAIFSALDSMSPDPTTTVWTTTSSDFFSFGSTTDSSSDAATSPSTTTDPSESTQATTEPTESTQATAEPTENSATTFEPTSSTDSFVARRENLIKRRLIDLLLKKLQ